MKNKFDLTNEGIIAARGKAEEFLRGKKVDEQETLRLGMMMEEVLLEYKENNNEGHTFSLNCGTTFGKINISVKMSGESLDPFEEKEVAELEVLRRLMRCSDSSKSWSYKNGNNIVSFSPVKKVKMSFSKKTILAVILGVIAGIIAGRFSEETQGQVLDNFINPTLKTIMGVITAVSGPMIFFSLLWGICTIGDTDTLSKIGKRMIARFMLILLMVSTLSALFCFPFFSGDTGSSMAFDFSEFYKMLLGVIPDNMIAPFISGNTQQIIFMAVISGIVILLLGSKVSSITNGVEQMTTMVQKIMILANTLIPFMVFLSILKVAMSGQFSEISRAYKVIPVYIGLSLLIILAYTFVVVVRHKVNPFTLWRKSGPAFLLALTTASSPAALATNLETCEKDFGIDKRIVRFGVPMGQTIFKPGSLSRFVVVGFCMAEIYGVAITPNWLTAVVVICFLLGVSSPPVAGGAVVCFSVMFSQLGIPEEAVGLALALNVLFDFILTAVNIYCLQMELIGLSGSLNMLDENTLRKTNTLSGTVENA